MTEVRDFDFYEYDRYIAMNDHYLYFINDDKQPLFGCKIYLATVSSADNIRDVLKEYYGASPYKLAGSSLDNFKCESIEDYFEAYNILKNYPIQVIKAINGKRMTVRWLSEVLKKSYVGVFISIESFIKSYFKLEILDTISICKNYRAVDFFDWGSLKDELEINGYFKFVHASQAVHVLKLK